MSRGRLAGIGGAVLAATVLVLIGSLHHADRAESKVVARARDDVLPLSFERNVGQADPRVRFLAHGLAGAVYLTRSEAVIVPTRSGSAEPDAGANAMRMTLVGANPHPRVSGADVLPGTVNYLVGARRADWHTSVSTYGQVVYHSVYPGIDLRYHGAEGRLEYDFDLGAGADPARIAIDLGGAREMRIDHAGNLWVTLGDRTIEERRPDIYQVLGGRRVIVRGGYRLLGRRRVGFALARYDPARPLVIDPTIVYSEQLVGSAPGEALGIAVDAAGDTYVTGETSSANFPTAHPLQAQPKGTNQSAFVAKLNPAGALVYATYLGGSAYTDGRGIAVDRAGDAYVTGATNSTNFPTTRHAFQTSYGGGPFDAFVTKLSPTGRRLVYSTFLGSTHYDEGNAIAVDAEGRAVVTGKTVSPDFPLRYHLSPITTGGAFVTKFNRAGTGLVSSTVFGGNGPGNHADTGFGIALDPHGDVYVTGETNDPGFPILNAFQPTLAGGGNAFVIKIDAAMTQVIYDTYLGGSGEDIGRAIAADSDGDAYVTGQTTSPNFPTVNALQTSNASAGPEGANAFVTKINPTGSALVYSTYLGGSDDDGAFGIAVDRSQNVYLAGQASSPHFPLVSPIQGTLLGPSDAFLTEIDGSGSFIRFSTYFGGSGTDAALAVALDRTGAVHFAGQTDSSNFPQHIKPHGPKRYAVPGDGAFVAVVHPR
jgi:Beta-propeller repeat